MELSDCCTDCIRLVLAPLALAELLTASVSLDSTELATELCVGTIVWKLLVNSTLTLSNVCAELLSPIPVDVCTAPIVLLKASDKLCSIEPVVDKIYPKLLVSSIPPLSDELSVGIVEETNSEPVDDGIETRELLPPSDRLNPVEPVVEIMDSADELDSTELDVPANVCAGILDPMLLEVRKDWLSDPTRLSVAPRVGELDSMISVVLTITSVAMIDSMLLEAL